jgi:hypothetical protein
MQQYFRDLNALKIAEKAKCESFLRHQMRRVPIVCSVPKATCAVHPRVLGQSPHLPKATSSLDPVIMPCVQRLAHGLS